MTRKRDQKSLLRALTVGAALTASPAIFAADVFLRPGVPDVDQVRNFLPPDADGRPGGMYCVPTSALNILYYMKYEAGMLGIPFWGFPTAHPLATGDITVLGAFMSTDPIKGTKGEQIFTVLKDMIEADPFNDPLIIHCYYGSGSIDSPYLLSNLLDTGGIARLSYGRYLVENGYHRKGGHSVTLAGYRKVGSFELRVADPASSDDDWDQQGAFTFDTKNVSTINIAPEELNFPINYVRYTNWSGKDGNYVALIDGVHGIWPMFAGWFETDVDIFRSSSGATVDRFSNGYGKYKGPGRVRVTIPWHLDSAKGVGPIETSFVPREEMLDWIFEPGQRAAYYVTHLGRIFRVDLLSGEHKLLHVLKGAKSLTIAGDRGDLFVLGDGSVRDWVAKLERQNNRLSVTELPAKGASIHYDPITHGPAVLWNGQTQVWTYDPFLRGYETKPLPVAPSGTGALIFAIDHSTGDFVVTREGATSYERWDRRTLDIRPSSEITDVFGPIFSLACTENSSVAVQSLGVVSIYDRYGAVKNTQFDGLRALGQFKLSRSHMYGAVPISDGDNNWFPDPELVG